MRRYGWLALPILLALSIGMNLGLVIERLGHHADRDEPFGDVDLPAGNPDDPGDHRLDPPPVRPGPRGPRPEPSPGVPPRDPQILLRNHLEHLERRLALDASQLSAITSAVREHLPRIIEQRQVADRLRDEIAGCYAAPSLDEARVRALTASLVEAQSTLDSLVTEGMLAEARHLTPQQRRLYARTVPLGAPPPPERRDRQRPPPRR